MVHYPAGATAPTLLLVTIMNTRPPMIARATTPPTTPPMIAPSALSVVVAAVTGADDGIYDGAVVVVGADVGEVSVTAKGPTVSVKLGREVVKAATKAAGVTAFTICAVTVVEVIWELIVTPLSNLRRAAVTEVMEMALADTPRTAAEAAMYPV